MSDDERMRMLSSESPSTNSNKDRKENIVHSIRFVFQSEVTGRKYGMYGKYIWMYVGA